MNYYKSIDELPVYNWFKLQKQNDLNWLQIGEKKTLDVKQMKQLQKAWEFIFGEFIDTFGISEEFKAVLQLQKEILMLQNDMLQTGDRSIITFINIKNFELRELTKEQPEAKIDIAKVHIEKYLGFRIDEKVTTVKEYYTYLKTIKVK